MIKPDRKSINRRNRRAGKNNEKKIAKILDGHVIPLSGAIKNSVFNLEGDISIRTFSGAKELLKVEAKTTSAITPKGERTFTLKKSVLDQARQEADVNGSLGCVWIHWNNMSHERDDYIVVPSDHFIELVHLARLGAEAEDRGFGDED